MDRHRLRYLALVLASAPVAATSLSAAAADFWWRGDVSSNWSTIGAGTNTNFASDSGGLVDRFSLPGSSDVVRFSTTNAANFSTTLGQNFSIQGLTTETTLPQNMSISGGSTLTVGTTGIVANAPRTLTINSFLTTNQLTLPINTANAASIVSLNEITFGDYLLHKSGPGTLNLSNSGQYTLGTTVSNGTLNTLAPLAFPNFSRLTLGDSVSGNTPRFRTNGFTQNLTLLTIFAPSSTATVIDVAGGTLTLAGNLSLLDTSSTPGNRFGASITAASGGTLNLSGNIRTFTLAGQNISQNELIIQPVITNGGIILNANPSTFNGSQAGLILDAASPNTYTGGTTINAGVLRVNNTTTLGPGPLTLNTTGSVASSVRLFNGSQTITSLSTTTVGTALPVVELNSGTQLTINQTPNTTFAGNIQGTGFVTKSGTGKLTLTGSNTFNGELFIDQGTLEIGNGGTSGSVSGRINNNSALIFNRSDSHTHSGQISGSGSFTKLGTGNLTLSNNSNDFTGDIFLSQGTITAGAANVLGLSFGSSNLTVGQPTSAIIATLNTAGFNQALNGLNLYARFSNAQEAILVGASTLSVSGDIKVLDHQDFAGNLFPTIIAASPGGKLDLTGSSTTSIVVAGQNNFGRDDLVIQPVITGFVNLEITASPSSTIGTPAGVVFAATSPNTYDGDTTVHAGTLTVDSTTSLGTRNLILNTTGAVESVVRLNNSAQTISELRTSNIGTVLPVLTLNGTALTVQNGGDFAGTIEGTGSVTFNRDMTLRSANSYTGTTTINSATLKLTGSGSISPASAISVNGNSLLRLERNNIWGNHTTATSSPITINDGGRVESVGNFNTLVNLTLNGGQLLASGGQSANFPAFALKGTVTVGGTTASFIRSNSSGDRINIGTTSAPGATTFHVPDVTQSADPDLTIEPILQDNRNDPDTAHQPSGLTKTGNGTLLIPSSNTYTGTTTISAGTLQIGQGGGSSTTNIAGPIVNNAKLIFEPNSDFSILAPISGTGDVTFTGFYTTTLLAHSSYTGTTKLINTTLQVGNPATPASIVSNVQLSDSATLAFASATSFTHTKSITGTGNLDLQTATSASQTFTGNINLDGTLVVSGDGTATLQTPATVTELFFQFGTGQPTLRLAPGGQHTLLTQNISLAGDSNLQTTDNDLIVNYNAQFGSPILSLLSFFNAGQIVPNADLNGLPTTLAIAEAADLGLLEFNGTAIDDTTVIAKYTYVGDANLDGQVDALDYERVDLAIGNSGVLGTAQGDLNYDGNVDALDYEQIDLNIGNGVGSPLGSVFIPEPVMLPLLTFSATLLVRRR